VESPRLAERLNRRGEPTLESRANRTYHPFGLYPPARRTPSVLEGDEGGRIEDQLVSRGTSLSCAVLCLAALPSAADAFHFAGASGGMEVRAHGS